MILANYFVMIICAIITLIISIVIFSSSIKEKKSLMSLEKCNFKDCQLCVDKEQCCIKREDLE